MLFYLKGKEKQIEQLIQQNEQQDYWSIVRKQFFKNQTSRLGSTHFLWYIIHSYFC